MQPGFSDGLMFVFYIQATGLLFSASAPTRCRVCGAATHAVLFGFKFKQRVRADGTHPTPASTEVAEFLRAARQSP